MEENQDIVSSAPMDSRPMDLPTMDDFDIFAPVKPDNSNNNTSSQQDDLDLFSFDPVGVVDSLSSPESPGAAGEDTTDRLTAPESSQLLSALEIPRDGIVTDNSCANLLDFDLLGSVSEVTEESSHLAAQSGNLPNFDSLGTLLGGDGTALGSASGTFASQDPFGGGDYMDVLIEGGSSPSPLMTPEVGSSNPLTPDEGELSSSPDHREEDTDYTAVPELGSPDEGVDLMMVGEAQGRRDPSGSYEGELLPQIKEAQASFTGSDEVNLIATDLVDTSSQIPSDGVTENVFDQSLQKQNHPGPSKLETVHKMKYKRLEYADSADSWGTSDSCPFTPPNSLVDGFQPAIEPFHLKEETLKEKIERSLPSLNIEEVDENQISEEGEEEAKGGGAEKSDSTVSCSKIAQVRSDFAFDSEVSQQNNHRSADTEQLTDVQTGAGGVESEVIVRKSETDSDTSKSYNNKAFQLALAMDLEETAIDDDDNGDSNTESSGAVRHCVQASASVPPQEANVIDQSIGEQISEARGAAIIINDEKGSAIDFSWKANVSAEPDGQDVKQVTSPEIEDKMWNDEMTNFESMPEGLSNAGTLNDFSDDLPSREEHTDSGDSAFQEQLQSMASNATSNDVGAHQITENLESNVTTPRLNMDDDGPVVHSRQNYQDLLSEEVPVPFESPLGAVVTFVNGKNLVMETSSSSLEEENKEQEEELREFVDNFINEEVIPAALETCRAEQEVDQLMMDNDDNSSDGLISIYRVSHTNDENSGISEENVDTYVTPLPEEDLASALVRVEISAEETVEGTDTDSHGDKALSDNVVITEVDLQSQGIFDIPSNVASAQIVHDTKVTEQEEDEEKSPSPQLHESDFTMGSDGANGTEIHTTVDKEGVGGEMDVFESDKRRPAGDNPSEEITFTKAVIDAENGQMKPVISRPKDHDLTETHEEALNQSPSDSLESQKNEKYELLSETGMCGGNGENQSEHPSIVIDAHDNDDDNDIDSSNNVSKSASSSSWEKESESTDLTSSASHFTMTSNEGEFIFGDESESLESPEESAQQKMSENEDVSPAPVTLHGYDNKSYESSTTPVSSEDDDDGNATVHGAAVEGGKLIYTAGSDVEAAYKFAQDVLRNSVRRYEASKIVKAATDGALKVVKSDSVTSPGQNPGPLTSSGVTGDNKTNPSLAAGQDNNADYPLAVDYSESQSSTGAISVNPGGSGVLGEYSVGEDQHSNRRTIEKQPEISKDEPGEPSTEGAAAGNNTAQEEKPLTGKHQLE